MADGTNWSLADIVQCRFSFLNRIRANWYFGVATHSRSKSIGVSPMGPGQCPPMSICLRSRMWIHVPLYDMWYNRHVWRLMTGKFLLWKSQGAQLQAASASNISQPIFNPGRDYQTTKPLSLIPVFTYQLLMPWLHFQHFQDYYHEANFKLSDWVIICFHLSWDRFPSKWRFCCE